jgi:uncharacterized protein with HEPN domain
MSRIDCNDYINHILEAARLACSYTDGLSKEDFLADKRTQQAVILNIVVIGEAATKLARDYPEFIEQHPDIRWKSMKGMRNRIAHGYLGNSQKIASRQFSCTPLRESAEIPFLFLNHGWLRMTRVTRIFPCHP